MFSQFSQDHLSPNQQFDGLTSAFSNLKIANSDYQSDADTILNKMHELLLTGHCSHPTIRFCSYYAAVLQHNLNLKNWEELEETLEQYFNFFKQLCIEHSEKSTKISQYGNMLHRGYSALLNALRTRACLQLVYGV